LLAILAPIALVRAQTGSAPEGGLEFLLPIGARSVGMGQAAVASAVGSDAVWWNPALIARGPREAAFHLTSKASLADADAAGVIIIPVQGVGAIAISARYINYGAQEAAGRDSTSITGTFVSTTTMLAATFAAPFGDRLSFGFTAKILSFGFSCSGSCADAGGLPLTSALDVGAHYFLMKDSTFSVGAAVRNVGFNLQVHDAPQSDPLPARGDVGISFAPKFPQMPKEARLRTAADVVTRIKGGDALGYRLGAELAWMERYQVRAGYVINGPTASGATFGLGFNTGKLQVDFSQMLSDLGDQGAKPTFVSLRYLF
jgi:hypothetical protein